MKFIYCTYIVLLLCGVNSRFVVFFLFRLVSIVVFKMLFLLFVVSIVDACLPEKCSLNERFAYLDCTGAGIVEIIQLPRLDMVKHLDLFFNHIVFVDALDVRYRFPLVRTVNLTRNPITNCEMLENVNWITTDCPESSTKTTLNSVSTEAPVETTASVEGSWGSVHWFSYGYLICFCP